MEERCSCGARPLVFFLVLLVLCMLPGVCPIPANGSDKSIDSFWLASNQKGRASVSLYSREQDATLSCSFEYSSFQQPTGETPMDPRELLKHYMLTNPCLTITNQHKYELCIGKEATQLIDQSNDPPISLGTFQEWNSKGEQIYTGGSQEHCSKQRTSKVQFTCGDMLQLVSVSEPTVCSYHFVVAVPQACGHPAFVTSSLETWYMEIFQVPGSDGPATRCVVHGAGFGLPSPTDSTVITDFALKIEKDGKPLRVARFEARRGQRLTYAQGELQVVDGVLKPAGKLSQAPNYLALTINH